MIIKHFHRHKWELENNWDNVDHIFGAPDADISIEDSERQIALNMSISDDEDESDDQQTTQRQFRQSQRRVETPRRTRPPIDLNDNSGPDTRFSQRLRQR